MDDAASAGAASAPRLHVLPAPAIDGAVRSAISQAIVRIHAEHYGKGATQAKTYVWDDLVVTVLRDLLTSPSARSSTSTASTRCARSARRSSSAWSETFRAAVERLTGRRVQSFMSQVDPNNGLGVEVFVLEPLGDGDGDDEPRAAWR